MPLSSARGKTPPTDRGARFGHGRRTDLPVADGAGLYLSWPNILVRSKLPLFPGQSPRWVTDFEGLVLERMYLFDQDRQRSTISVCDNESVGPAYPNCATPCRSH